MITLENYIEKNYKFTPQDIEKIVQRFESKTLDKNDFFLKEGQYCTGIAFVEAGTFIYYTTSDGEEKVCDFAFERDWITHFKSLRSNTPSEMNIRALELSQLKIITASKLEELTTEMPAVNQMRANLAELYFTFSAEHSANLATLKAEERYKRLIQDKPHIHQKVPQYYIASFLGIKPQSLSRLRAKK